jgi:hypothetical protein
MTSHLYVHNTTLYLIPEIPSVSNGDNDEWSEVQILKL